MDNVYDRHDLESRIPGFVKEILGIRRNCFVSIVLWVMVVLLVAGLVATVYLTGGIKFAWSHLLYVPIVFSAFVWGWRGGVVVGLASGLLLGPLMPIDVATGQMQDFHNWFIRLLIFCFVGALTGFAAEHIIRVTKQLYRYSTNLVESYDNLLYVLANSLDARDAYTHQHSEMVAKLAVEIGKRMGLPKCDLVQLERLGVLHDIGKIGIPNEILNKPGPLNDQEWKIMKSHPVLGENIIKPVKFLEPITKSIRCHHEKWDGSGYPDGIKGEDIPLFSRIIIVADVYQALVSERPYRNHYYSQKSAREYIKENSGTLFDPAVVDAFLSISDDVVESVCPGGSQNRNTMLSEEAVS